MKSKVLVSFFIPIILMPFAKTYAGIIEVDGTHDEHHAVPTTLTDSYDFKGLGGILDVRGPVTFTESFINSLNGRLNLRQNDTIFTYSGGTLVDLAQIDLGQSAAAFIKSFVVDNPNGETTINSEFIVHSDSVKSIIFATPVVLTHNAATNSFKNLGPVYIGTPDAPSSITFRAENLFNTLNTYNISHEDSTIIFDAASNTSDFMTFQIGDFGGILQKPDANGAPEDLDPPLAPPNDAVGIVKIIANGSEVNGINFSTRSWGISDASRLKLLTLEGDSQIGISSKVRTKNIEFKSTAPVVFSDIISMGVGNKIDVFSDTIFETSPHTLTATNTEFNLGSKNFNIRRGTMRFLGDAIINLEFDDISNECGKISIGGGANAAKLDIDTLNSLQINFTATTANENTSHDDRLEFQFPLFETHANGSIDDFVDHANINFTPDESNLFMSWNYDKNTYLISSTTNWDGLLAALAPPPEPAPAPAPNPAPPSTPVSQNAVAIVKEITESAKALVRAQLAKELVEDKATKVAAAKFIQFAGTLGSIEEVRRAAANLDPVQTEPLGDNSFHESMQIVNSRVVDLNIDSLYNFEFQDLPLERRRNISSNYDNYAILGDGVAAGDDAAKKYGIWFTPFIHKAIQKAKSDVDSYKVENVGAVLGFDTRISDSILVGAAWGNVKSMLRMTGLKEGSKGNTRGNVFNLYSSLSLPKDSFITFVASYGQSKIKRLERRHLASNIYNFAKSHYKTKMYSAEMIFGKNIYYKNSFVLTPMTGIKYSEFHDDAYKENGTLFHNYRIPKKKYSNLDCSIGAKLSYNTFLNGFRIVPNITTIAYINLKYNPAKAYVTGDTFTNPVQLTSDKRSSRTWYSITPSLDFQKDNIEYAIEYEYQIDKKYRGHQAKIKAKLNF